MTILNFEGFMNRYNLRNDTMNESQLQRVYNYKIYPRVSKINSDKGFIKIDNGSRNGTHWTCFIIKNTKSYYFDSFGGAPYKFLSNDLPKPIIYHNHEIQGTNSKTCGSYCFCLFYLIERMNYYDTVLRLVF